MLVEKILFHLLSPAAGGCLPVDVSAAAEGVLARDRAAVEASVKGEGEVGRAIHWARGSQAQC